MGDRLDVSSVMSASPVVVGAELCLRDLAVCLDRWQVGAAPVVDGGRVVGMFSERDVVHALAQGADPDEVWSSDVMTPDPLWVEPDDDLERALDLMLKSGVRHLPVMRSGEKLLGVVSLGDVARALVGRRPTL